MKNLNIVAIQEGATIPEDIAKKYQLTFADTSKNLNLEQISAFCGVIRRGSSILVSFPKHYIHLDVFNQLSISEKLKHIRLILDSILNYELNPTYSSFRKKNGLSNSFSFISFFKIYDYFQKYGLYVKSKRGLKMGYNGKISWKDTIKKSQKVISDGNLVFLPFCIRENVNAEDFITKCMIFAINYTEELFGKLLDLPDNSTIASRGIEKVLISNSRAVILKLEMMRQRIFKDIDKSLVNDLITFFRGLNDNYQSIKDIKHYHFNNVWEKSVEKYLNNYFVGIKNNKLEFSSSGRHFKFKKLVLKNYNDVLKRSRDNLQPDHYCFDNEHQAQYIFDSKYYDHINGLNYKQFVYHMILYNKANETYDALIMPSEDKTFTEVHLDLDKEYLPIRNQRVKILLTHLRTQDVLQNFTESGNGFE